MALVNALIPAVRIRVKPHAINFRHYRAVVVDDFNCDW